MELKGLNMERVPFGEAGTRLLASRCWARLDLLNLQRSKLGGAGGEALARGEWPVPKQLDLCGAGPLAPRGSRLTALEAARRWAPTLEELGLDPARVADGFGNGERSESGGESSESGGELGE
jgi:hypothetical protein